MEGILHLVTSEHAQLNFLYSNIEQSLVDVDSDMWPATNRQALYVTSHERQESIVCEQNQIVFI